MSAGQQVTQGGHGAALKHLSAGILSHYTKTAANLNVEFGYSADKAPRRVLTKPAEPVQGRDNVDGDYICYVGEMIRTAKGEVYEILEQLGKGTFGQVLECARRGGGREEKVAVKIVKRKRDYARQAESEVDILRRLTARFGTGEESRFVGFLTTFEYEEHFCIAMELLELNLFQVLQRNKFRGLATPVIAAMARQLLEGLSQLRAVGIVHTDLKPENIALVDLQCGKLKILDFGSASENGKAKNFYVQSRFYRSPEVILGLSYDFSIDMWSLGCVLAELYLGKPIFPGTSSHDQLKRIVLCLGDPPREMLQRGRYTERHYHIEERLLPGELLPGDQGSDLSTGCEDTTASSGSDTEHDGRLLRSSSRRLSSARCGEKRRQSVYAMKTQQEYEIEARRKASTSKRDYEFTSIRAVMEQPSIRSSIVGEQREQELARRQMLEEMLRGMLQISPARRWTPDEALRQPFVQKKA